MTRGSAECTFIKYIVFTPENKTKTTFIVKLPIKLLNCLLSLKLHSCCVFAGVCSRSVVGWPVVWYVTPVTAGLGSGVTSGSIFSGSTRYQGQGSENLLALLAMLIDNSASVRQIGVLNYGENGKLDPASDPRGLDKVQNLGCLT